MSEENFLKKWEKKTNEQAIEKTNSIWSVISYARGHLPTEDERPSIYSNTGLLIDIVDNLLDYITWKEQVYDDELKKLRRRIEKLEGDYDEG